MSERTQRLERVFSPQARFWLAWAVRAGQSLPAALTFFDAIIPIRSLRSFTPADVESEGRSTPQIIAVAIICFGRDDRVGEI